MLYRHRDQMSGSCQNQHCRKGMRAGVSRVANTITSLSSQASNHTSLLQGSGLNHHVCNSLWAAVLGRGTQPNRYMRTLLLGPRWDQVQAAWLLRCDPVEGAAFFPSLVSGPWASHPNPAARLMSMSAHLIKPWHQQPILVTRMPGANSSRGKAEESPQV